MYAPATRPIFTPPIGARMCDPAFVAAGGCVKVVGRRLRKLTTKTHCPPGRCDVEQIAGNGGFTVYRCRKCGCEEWL
jgi:hypothetical protein